MVDTDKSTYSAKDLKGNAPRNYGNNVLLQEYANVYSIDPTTQ